MRISGFTLIECFLALALTALLLTGAIHTQRNLINRHSATDAMSRWINTLQFARAYALATGQTTAVCSSDTTQCQSDNYTRGWFVFAERASGTMSHYDANETILATAAPLNQRLHFYTTATAPVRFTAFGHATVSGRFIVCAGTERTPIAGIFLIHSGRIRPAKQQELNPCD